MLIFSIMSSIIIGVLLHSLYKISNKNIIVGLFSATNESVWEHLKLSFFSIIIVGIIEYILLKGNVNNFLASKTIATVVAMIFTVIGFYTYTGIIGKDNFIADLSIFIVGIVIAEILSYKIINMPNIGIERISTIITISIALIFAIYTINPPHIPLFQDPITKQYGIRSKN